jgi:hypothetical protein
MDSSWGLGGERLRVYPTRCRLRLSTALSIRERLGRQGWPGKCNDLGIDSLDTPVMRTEVASLVDFGFEPVRPPGVLGEVLSGAGGRAGASERDRRLAERYAAGSEWLWYAHGEVSPHEAPLFHERRRLCLAADPEDPSAAADLSVLVLPSRGVGVATAWVKGSREDPWRRKHELWERHGYR